MQMIEQKLLKIPKGAIGRKKLTHTFFCKGDSRGVGSCGSMIVAVACHEGFLLVCNHNHSIVDAVSLCLPVRQSGTLMTDHGLL